MNPDATNIVFCVVTLMCGCVSWQSVICMVSCMFNEEDVVYNSLFVVLGGGTLFGGLLVKLKDIPMFFKPIYYISVTAITQRALVVNDFLCCYLTASCSESASSSPFNSTAPFSNNLLTTDQCPSALAFVGDGSDEGNLGRLTLSVTGKMWRCDAMRCDAMRCEERSEAMTCDGALYRSHRSLLLRSFGRP